MYLFLNRSTVFRSVFLAEICELPKLSIPHSVCTVTTDEDTTDGESTDEETLRLCGTHILRRTRAVIKCRGESENGVSSVALRCGYDGLKMLRESAKYPRCRREYTFLFQILLPQKQNGAEVASSFFLFFKLTFWSK